MKNTTFLDKALNRSLLYEQIRYAYYNFDNQKTERVRNFTLYTGRKGIEELTNAIIDLAVKEEINKQEKAI